jgi:hypothetical protein
MKFPDPPLIGRSSSGAPAAGRKRGGTALHCPRRRPGAASSPTRLPAARAVMSACRPRRRARGGSARGDGFRVFSESEYLHLVDLRDAGDDAPATAKAPYPVAATDGLRARVEPARFAHRPERRSQRGLLTAAIVGGGLAAALMAAAKQAAAPRPAYMQSVSRARAQRRDARPRSEPSAAHASVAGRPGTDAGALRAHHRSAGGGGPRRSIRSQRRPRPAPVAAVAHAAPPRRRSQAPSTATAESARWPAQKGRGAGALVRAHASRENADFSFER